jgi:hypothetical protein
MGDTALGRIIGTAAPILMILNQLKIAPTIVTITYAGLVGRSRWVPPSHSASAAARSHNGCSSRLTRKVSGPQPSTGRTVGSGRHVSARIRTPSAKSRRLHRGRRLRPRPVPRALIPARSAQRVRGRRSPLTRDRIESLCARGRRPRGEARAAHAQRGRLPLELHLSSQATQPRVEAGTSRGGARLARQGRRACGARVQQPSPPGSIRRAAVVHQVPAPERREQQR